ncbi:MAG: hypothetical protein ABSF10_22165 [Verrucomicrobiota bacterium]|jgi:hypothetical protein
MEPTPKVTRDDVEQMVRRDFPAEQFEKVMSILDEIKKNSDDARASFQLNILKLSHGKIELLHRNIDAFYTNFAAQPVPQITRKQVERIIHRDFPAEQFAEVAAILDEYGKKVGSMKPTESSLLF